MIYHCIDAPQPSEGHLGCFQVLATINKVGINMCVQVFVWMSVFNSFMHSFLQVWGHMVNHGIATSWTQMKRLSTYAGFAACHYLESQST